MKLFGTILNGQVQLDRPTDLPDGTRIVSLVGGELEDMEDFGDFSGFEYPHPMAPCDPVKEAALIRERVPQSVPVERRSLSMKRSRG